MGFAPTEGPPEVAPSAPQSPSPGGCAETASQWLVPVLLAPPRIASNKGKQKLWGRGGDSPPYTKLWVRWGGKVTRSLSCPCRNF